MDRARYGTDPPVKAGLRIAGAAATLALLSACVPQPGREQVSRVPAFVPKAPPPPLPPPPVALAADWQDWPVTPGTWSYTRDAGGSTARYGTGLWLRCEMATRSVAIGRDGVVVGTPDGSAMMTLRTSYGPLQWPAQPLRSDRRGIEAVRSASDVGLDWIAFSRGRFTVELRGLPPLVVPNWAEAARVIEDCRG